MAVAAAVALIIILSGFSLWAFIERTKALKGEEYAEEQRIIAENASKVAERKRTILEKKPCCHGATYATYEGKRRG